MHRTEDEAKQEPAQAGELRRHTLRAGFRAGERCSEPRTARLSAEQGAQAATTTTDTKREE